MLAIYIYVCVCVFSVYIVYSIEGGNIKLCALNIGACPRWGFPPAGLLVIVVINTMSISWYVTGRSPAECLKTLITNQRLHHTAWDGENVIKVEQTYIFPFQKRNLSKELS